MNATPPPRAGSTSSQASASHRLTTTAREEILRLTAEFLELHRQHWPEFEGECEVRPIEFLASDARGAK